MASYSVVTATHKTLTAGTVDTVTITGSYSRVEVLNRSGSADIYFTNDGSTPTGGCENCFVVPAGTSLNIAASDSAGNEVINLVGNGNGYSVLGTDDHG